jgi:hypothetical protein
MQDWMKAYTILLHHQGWEAQWSSGLCRHCSTGGRGHSRMRIHNSGYSGCWIDVRSMHPFLEIFATSPLMWFSWAMSQTAARCNDVNNGSVNQIQAEDSCPSGLWSRIELYKKVTYDGNQGENANYTMVQQKEWLVGRSSSTWMTPTIDDLGISST